MKMTEALLKELDAEFMITQRFLNQVPENQYDWAPHQKSMKMLASVSHIAELPEWIWLSIETDGLDFQVTPYQPKQINNNVELTDLFETSYQKGRSSLLHADPATFENPWSLRHGEQILVNGTRYEMIRNAISQIIHHRAQLGVYFRLLGIPVPGSYGSSADDPNH